MGSCSNEADAAALHVGQKGILLGAVEAVDFVDEENGGTGRAAGTLEGAAQLGHVGQDGVQAQQLASRFRRYGFGEGGFPAAGRAEEEQVPKGVLPDKAGQKAVSTEELFLADNFT
jgi:hypothetical protein